MARPTPQDAHDPTDMLGNAEREERRDLEKRLAEQKAKADLAAVMATEQGRRVMRAVVEHTGIYRTSMTGNSYTFFNEGKRDVGLFLIAKITEAAPQYLAEMLITPE